MWQTLVVMVILGGVLVYLARYFLRILRARDSGCGCCAGCPDTLPGERLSGCHPQGPGEFGKH